MDLLYDRELKEMKIYFYRHHKIGNNKDIALQLSEIPPNAKDILLREYFKMCKMLYRIRSLAMYTWEMCSEADEAVEKIKELYNENTRFAE